MYRATVDTSYVLLYVYISVEKCTFYVIRIGQIRKIHVVHDDDDEKEKERKKNKKSA